MGTAPSKFVSLYPVQRGHPVPSKGSYGGSPAGTALPTAVPPWWALALLWRSTSTRVPEMGVGFACHSEQEEAGATSLHVHLHTRVTPTSNGSMPAGVPKSFPVDFKSSKTKILLYTLTWTEQRKWRGFFTNILALGLDIPKFLSNHEIPAAMTEDCAVCLAH